MNSNLICSQTPSGDFMKASQCLLACVVFASSHLYTDSCLRHVNSSQTAGECVCSAPSGTIKPELWPQSSSVVLRSGLLAGRWNQNLKTRINSEERQFDTSREHLHTDAVHTLWDVLTYVNPRSPLIRAVTWLLKEDSRMLSDWPCLFKDRSGSSQFTWSLSCATFGWQTACRLRLSEIRSCLFTLSGI